MKRNIFIVSAILLILAGFFSACKENDEDIRKVYSIKEGKFDIAENEFVTMRVLPEDIFANSSMKLIIENKTKEKLLYGADFSLEYFDKENWTQIQLDINFEHIGYILNTNGTAEEQFYVSEKYFHRLGRYRIVKNFSLYSNFPFEVDSSFNLYAEFGIK